MITRQYRYSARILLAMGATLAMVGLTTSRSHAEPQPSTDTEDMRRELRQLRAQVQLLRAALGEAAELDAQRAAALNRALKATAPAVDTPTARSREDLPDKARGSSGPPPGAAAQIPAPSAVAMAAVPSVPPTAPRSSRRSEGTRRIVEAPPAAGIIRGRVAVPKGEPVAYVYVENVPAPPVKDQHQVIEQVGKKFVPAWAVVQRGTVISFPNRDNIYHNVFSLSSGNSFDLGLYSGGEAKSHTFNDPGEVEIYCNIHPQMAASTLVVPNRLYAKVRPDGSFEIPGVPAGKRKVVAWAPGSHLAVSWVDLEQGGTAQVDFRLESKASGHKNKAGQQYGSYE